MKRVFMAALAASLMCSTANAKPLLVEKIQSDLETKVNPDIAAAKLANDKAVDAVINWATGAASADLDAAIALSTASNNVISLPCWTSIKNFVDKIKTLPPQEKLPTLHIATRLEVATELMLALQPDSPIVVSCGALANFQKKAVIGMVSGIITGAAKLGTGFAIPGL